jgi:hypothetical protein
MTPSSSRLQPSSSPFSPPEYSSSLGGGDAEAELQQLERELVKRIRKKLRVVNAGRDVLGLARLSLEDLDLDRSDSEELNDREQEEGFF